MIASSTLQFDYESLCRKNSLAKNQLKPFLLERIDEIFAMMYHIDIGIAGDRDALVRQTLNDIKPIVSEIEAMQLQDIIGLLEKIMGNGSAYSGALQRHYRIDHLIKALRHAVYFYQQKVEKDL